MSARCRSCNAEIIWAVTVNGKRVPLDAVPDPLGNVQLVAGVARVYGANEQQPVTLGATTHTSHFATCPNAAQHRRAR